MVAPILTEMFTQLRDFPDSTWGGLASLDPDSGESQVDSLRDRHLNNYVAALLREVRAGALGDAQIGEAIAAVDAFCGRDGEAKLTISNLLRYLTRQLPDRALYRRALDLYLGYLVLAARYFLEKARSARDQAYRDAASVLRDAARLLKSDVEESFEAETLAEYEECAARYRLIRRDYNAYDVAEGLELLASALKRSASASYRDHLLRPARYHAERALQDAQIAGSPIGQGALVRTLEAAQEIFVLADSPALIERCGSTLLTAYSGARQADRAIELAHALLQRVESPAERARIEFELGCKLAESQAFEEALGWQRAAMAGERWFDEGSDAEAGAHLALGNTLKNLRREDDALKEYALAQQAATGADLRIRILAMQGDLQAGLGDHETARVHLEEAEDLLDELHDPVDVQRFHQVAGLALSKGPHREAARRHLDLAASQLRDLLGQGPTPATWHSQLTANNRVFAKQVEFALQDAETAQDSRAAIEALTHAEASKSRLITWMQWAGNDGAARAALGLERQTLAIDRSSDWTRECAGRAVLSFHCGHDGLAAFVIQDGEVRGHWLEDVSQGDWLRRFESWHERLDEVTSGVPERGLMTGMTEALLDWLGEIIHRVLGELSTPMRDLVVVPHRYLHGLPFAHARLPGNRYLSDLVERIVVFPSLAEFDQQIRWPGWNGAGDYGFTALVDSDGSLPFARAESHAMDFDRVACGDAVTKREILAALHKAEYLLLSCHGYYDTGELSQSFIQAADGRLDLLELIDVLGRQRTQPRLIVLGVCEGGRSNRSVADEPFGVANTLVLQSNGAVIAPLWPVDDFVAWIFITNLFRRLQAGEAPQASIHATARWMRGASATDLLQLLENEADLAGDDNGLRSARAQIRAWLDKLPRRSRPLASPLDWAAFQCWGLYVPEDLDGDQNTR